MKYLYLIPLLNVNVSEEPSSRVLRGGNLKSRLAVVINETENNEPSRIYIFVSAGFFSTVVIVQCVRKVTVHL